MSAAAVETPISRMITSGLCRVIEFIAINTDLQALAGEPTPRSRSSSAPSLTKGLGAGANPDIGRQAARRGHREDLRRARGRRHGLRHRVASAAAPAPAPPRSSPRSRGQLGGDDGSVLTVAVVTLPFRSRGQATHEPGRSRASAQLRESVDSVIAIPNDRLLADGGPQHPRLRGLPVADDVLRQACRASADIITVPGQINLDFADVRAVMKGMGQAVMGTGMGQGENRAVEAAQRAISNPLLEDTSIEGAKGVVVNITGGSDLSLAEAAEATALITKVADSNANVIYGIVTDEAMGNAVKVTVIATGFSRGPRKAAPTPVDLVNYVNPAAPAAESGGSRRGRGLLSQDAQPQGGGGRGRSLRSRRAGLPPPQGRRRRRGVKP